MLIIPVGLSSLSLVHAMEVEQHVHEQHQCEIYDAILNAISYPVSSVTLVALIKCSLSFSTLEETACFTALPRTRSPPLRF